MKFRQPTPDQALGRLISGNKRFANGLLSVDSIASGERRKQLARDGQNPFAIVLTCSDSRVPAEIVFDAGLGDLFVVRVAGNIVAPSLIASIEFAALTFGAPVCVVMGHSGCGAIKGAVSGVMRQQGSLTSNLDILLKEIEPAALGALASISGTDRTKDLTDSVDEIVNKAIELNVLHSIEQLRLASPHLCELSEAGTFKIVGAVYDISAGTVDFMLPDMS
jgi:carbonic anhydrase